MLARASSDAGTRLRRSKSTSTVHRHAQPAIEPLDPDIAQQQAIAAATIAFFRSQPQESIEGKAKRSVELSRSKSTASRKSLTSQGSHFPPRALSVRSLPPKQRTLTTSTHRKSTSLASQPDELPFTDPTPSSYKPPSSARLSSAQPLIGLNDNGRPSSQPKSNRYSAASSVTSQQIRKARSMYYASSVQTGSPIARPPSKYLTTPPPTSISSTLNVASRAYVPTRAICPSPLAAPQVPVAIGAGETVDSARDRYLQSFQQRSIKHKPSLFLAPFKKRQDRSKDNAKRLSSIITSMPPMDYNSADSTVDNVVCDFIPPQDVKERRSFSGSLRKKIRKVFRRTSDKPHNLPVQQIQASRDYFQASVVPKDGNLGEIPSPSEELLRTARSRSPSSPSWDGNHTHPIRSVTRSSSKDSDRSNRSLHSESNVSHLSASRVTSWGTSTSGETLTQRAIKRLTVIHEAKDSIRSAAERSSSTLNKRKSLPLPAFTAFKDPLQVQSLTGEATTIDPKRVFSALLREIDSSKSAEPPTNQPDHTSGGESDVFESSRTKELHSSGHGMHSSTDREHSSCANGEQLHVPRSVGGRSVPAKKSSIRSFGQALRSTIRTVTPGEQRHPPNEDDPAGAQDDSSSSSPTDTVRSVGDQDGRSAMFKHFRLSKKKSAIMSQEASADTCTPSAEQIEQRVARAKNRWQTNLNESKLPQFPRETDRLHTVAEIAEHCPRSKANAACEPQTSAQSLATQRLQPIETPMSPSVYSRNTDGASILPTDSVLSFMSPQQHQPAQPGGSAVIQSSQSVRSYVIGTPSPKRPSSSRSSCDWKAWLSNEVSAIETVRQETLEIDERYHTPSQRHKCDPIQTLRTSRTGSEDTTVIIRDAIDTLTPQGRLLQNEILSKQHTTKSHKSSVQIATLSADTDVCSTPRELVAGQTQKLDETHVSRPALSEGQSTPSSISSTTQVPLTTPGSARMNDRFPYLDTGKRSSSNNSRRSRQSASPASSEGSSLKVPKGTSQSRTIYSDLSASTVGSNSVGATAIGAGGAVFSQKSMENMTPPSMVGHGKWNVSTVRPKSLQPLSPSAWHQNSLNVVDSLTDTPNTGQSKHASVPVDTVRARPSLRITIRPLSPEKHLSRPHSAFDLRSTPLPRPASEIRRPALQTKSSPRLSTHESNPRTGSETPDHTSHSVSQRDSSVTPGQRMADRFLKERKSAAVLERGLRKSAGKFVREDTPAFL